MQNLDLFIWGEGNISVLKKHGDEVVPYFIGTIWWLSIDDGINSYGKKK